MKTIVLRRLACLVAVAMGPTVGVAQDKAAVARQAHEILKTNCYGCHGEEGKVEGKINYILEVKTLVSRKLVIPGNPAKSKIIKRIVSGEMPPDTEKQRPSKKDIAILEQWIKDGPIDGTVEPATEFISAEKMVSMIQSDLLRQRENDCRFIRYFTITHLYNAKISDNQLQTYRNGLSKLLNSLSWGRKIARPHAIDPGRTIFRIDLRDYKWNEEVWNSILAQYPYGILFDSKNAEYCSSVTGTKLPFVRADWFVANASQPPLYHHVLQIPATDRELERMLRVDVYDNIKGEQVLRAGFNDSGISNNNRLIERHESGYGYYWKSYDFASNVGKKNLFEFPLGPGKGAKNFEHDGGEIIFSLPNGLQGYMLVNAKGSRLDKGPIAIVSDKERPDRTVVNGLSCMRCHTKGMIKKDDQIRGHVETNDVRFKKNERETILALYPLQAKLDGAVKADRERFLAALKETGCKEGTMEPIFALTKRFEDQLDLTMAAAEAGLTPAEFKRKVNLSAKLSRTIGSVNVDGGTVQRDVFSAAFKDIVRELELGIYFKQIAIITNSIGMKFVWIPPGSFLMGSPANELGRQHIEIQHKVALTRGFYMGVHTVTQEQWQEVMGNNPSFCKGEKNLPVEQVSWVDCQEFIKKLREKEARPYRLPTEAEWEFACRAGTSAPFHFGETIAADQANYNSNFIYGNGKRGLFRQKTTPVGSFPANAWGLHDMHGNVWQWCQDWIGPYAQNDVDDPQGPQMGQSRVLRGGSWYHDPSSCRSANRNALGPGFRNGYVGLRVCFFVD